MKKNKQIENFSPSNFRILKDFQILLEYINENKPIASIKTNRIPSQSVIELNQKITKTLKLDLKHHHQTSYPHINSLILVFRASGIGIVNYSNNKLILTVDNNLYKQWLSLNNTEKYINLLIAWLYNGVPGIIGIAEELPRCLDHLLAFMLAKQPKESFSNPQDLKALESPKYSVGTHNIALLEMFGFVEIIDNENIVSKKWNIEQIKITDLGIMVFQTIHQVTRKIGDKIYYQESLPVEFKSELQREFKEIFTNYKSDIQIITKAQTNIEYILKVSLGGIWRRIAIPSGYPLDSFCSYLIDCFDFDHSHLYRILIRNRFGYYKTFNHPSIDDDYFGYPCADEFTMNDLDIGSGTTMDFIYDFGDNWRFDIVCEKTETQKTKDPRVIEQKGKSPEQYN